MEGGQNEPSRYLFIHNSGAEPGFSWVVAELRKWGPQVAPKIQNSLNCTRPAIFWPKKRGGFLPGRGPRHPGPRIWIRPCIYYFQNTIPLVVKQSSVVGSCPNIKLGQMQGVDVPGTYGKAWYSYYKSWYWQGGQMVLILQVKIICARTKLPSDHKCFPLMDVLVQKRS